MDDIKDIRQLVSNSNQQVTEVKSKLEVPTLTATVDTEKSYADQAKDIVGVLATQKAIEDEKLVKEVTDLKKEELKADATANLKKEQASSQKAEVELQHANYGVFEGVATYAGIKKPLPKKMQNVLFFTLSVIQIILLIIVGVPTSIINIIADCVDSIVAKLSSIAKSARVLVLSLLVILLCAVIAYVIYRLLNYYNLI